MIITFNRYVVIYVRNDTGKPTSIETREPKVSLKNLYPGAGYEIKVNKRLNRVVK